MLIILDFSGHMECPRLTFTVGMNVVLMGISCVNVLKCILPNLFGFGKSGLMITGIFTVSARANWTNILFFCSFL